MSESNQLNQRVLESHLSIHLPGKSGGNLRRLWSIGMTLSGRSEDTTAEGSFSQNRYDVTILQPQGNVSHVWRVPRTGAPWKILWFLVNPHPAWLIDAPFPEIVPGSFRLSLKGNEVVPKVQEAFLAAHRVLHSRWPNRYELCLNSLERALLWCRTAIVEQGQRTDPRVLRALDYIMQHPFEAIRLGRLCRLSGLSPSRFMELFREGVGTTPRMYWERERLRQAQNLLRYTNKPIKEIAAIVGYKYFPHFCRCFRRYAGLTPMAFREQATR